ncbi:MAG: PadR family transcriptional regulator [Vicinamibacterales bacterium]
MPPKRIPTSTQPLKNEVLLVLLALVNEPMHGYAVMQKIEEDSNGTVVLQAGAFYRLLRNMLEDGLVEERPDPERSPRDARKRRFYRVTARGRAVAQAALDRLAALVQTGRRSLARPAR